MGLCAQAADKRKEGQLECRGGERKGEERQWREGKVERWRGREKKERIKQKVAKKNATTLFNKRLKQQEKGEK